MCIIKFICCVFVASQVSASECKPKIQVGRNNNIEIDGFIFIDCCFSSCRNALMITFEKNNLIDNEQWKPVFEGVNNTMYRALKTADFNESLENRNQYGAFPVKHTLLIKPLKMQDHGNWRCVLLNNDGKYTSRKMEVNIYVIPQNDSVYIEPRVPTIVVSEKKDFTCTVDGIHPEPDVVWTVNGEEQTKGTQANTKRDDGLWSIVNTIRLGFDDSRVHVLSCVIQHKTQERVLNNQIQIDVKKQAVILTPQEDMHITPHSNSKFTLHCSGTGYRPRIHWRRNGIDIMDSDTEYTIEKTCSSSICVGSITPTHTNPVLEYLDRLDYSGVYTCIISLQPPYKSHAISPDINVHLSRKHYNGDNYEVNVALCMCFFLMSAAAFVLGGYQARQRLCKEHTDAGDDVESKGTSSTFDTGDDNDYKDQLLQHSSFEDLETSEDSQSSEFLSRRILKDITQLTDSGCSVGSDILLSIERLTSSSNNIYDEGFNDSGCATYSVIKKVGTCNGGQSTQTECSHMEYKEPETDNGCTKDIQMQTDCVAVSKRAVQTQNVEQKEVGIQTSDDPAANCELVSFVAAFNDSIEKIQFIMEEIAKILTVDHVLSNTQRSHNICPLEQPMNRCYEMLRNIRLSIVSLGGRRPGSIDEQSAGCSLINHKNTDFIAGMDTGLFKDQAIKHILKRPGEEHKDENTHPRQSVTNQTGRVIFDQENGASMYPLKGHNSTKTTNEENQIKLVSPESTSQVKMQGRIEKGDLVQLLHSKNEVRRSTTNSKGIWWNEDTCMSWVRNQTGRVVFEKDNEYPLTEHNSTKITDIENQINLVLPESTRQAELRQRIEEGDLVQLLHNKNEVQQRTTKSKGIGWNEAISQCFGLPGVILRIRSNGSVNVRFINNKLWVFEPVVLRKVNMTDKKPEIADCVIVTTNGDELELLQKQIGLWMRNMEKKCGKFGILREIQDNYMLIEIDGSTFKFNKQAIRLVAKGGEYTELMTKRSDTV